MAEGQHLSWLVVLSPWLLAPSGCCAADAYNEGIVLINITKSHASVVIS